MVRGGVEGVSTSAAALARKVLGSMTRLKLIAVALGAMVAGAAITGGVMVAVQRARPVAVEDGKDPVPLLPNDMANYSGPIPGLPDLIPGKDLEKPPEPEPADALRIALGDFVLIEVLEALPGRPLTGERPVRRDGTISLGFYGDIQVFGLTRREVKVAVIGQLR